MARVTRVAPHLTLDEVKRKLDTATKPWLRQRWLVIYTALLDPRPAAEIAAQIGVSRAFVSKISSLYKRFGPHGLETVGPGGRRNEYLSALPDWPGSIPDLVVRALPRTERVIAIQVERDSLEEMPQIVDTEAAALEHFEFIV